MRSLGIPLKRAVKIAPPPKKAHDYEQPLRRPQMERFAQNIAKGGNISDAFIDAGYKSRDPATRATVMYKRSQALQARVAYLMSQYADAAAVTVGELTSMFRSVFKGAMGVKQYSAANGAAFNLGKLHGLIVDKAQVEVIRRPTRDPDAPAEVSIEGWIETLEGGQEVVKTEDLSPADRAQGPARAPNGNGGPH